MTANIFEHASRVKTRFPSNRGDLTTEQLWDLPLQSKSGFDLDSVAKAVNSQLKAVTEESFVSTGTNPAKSKLEHMLETVKHVIAVRLRENAEAATKAARAAERQKLVDALSDKQDAAIKDMTPDQIKARIEELDGGAAPAAAK